jgi:hypothetical protein
MKMSSVVFILVMLPLWLPLWSTFSFCMSSHCDSSFHNLCNICQSSLYYYVFSLVLPIWYFVILKMHSLFTIVMLSHNIVASLWCCSVDCFILTVTIMRYDCKLALKIVIRKLFMVGIYKP